jgi:hypothetical protein
MYEYLTENGHGGSELLDVVSPAHREITPEIIEECTKDINNYE